MLLLIPPSHLFGISRNQAEPAGMKNFQNSRHIREGISNPSHTRGGMSRNDVGMEILYIFLDMRFGGVLNYVRTHSRANRDVPTAHYADGIRAAFERQSKDSDDILNCIPAEFYRFSRQFSSSLHSILENVLSISSWTLWNVRMLVSISSLVDQLF